RDIAVPQARADRGRAGGVPGLVRELQHHADAGRLRCAADHHHVRPHRQGRLDPGAQRGVAVSYPRLRRAGADQRAGPAGEAAGRRTGRRLSASPRPSVSCGFVMAAATARHIERGRAACLDGPPARPWGPRRRRLDMATRGFTGRPPAPDIARLLPPGQALTQDFPVMSAGATPQIRLSDWSFTLKIGPRPVARWGWDEFNALPQTGVTRDIHCVTTWSKLNTRW